MFKWKNGITLIAVVVTIIILLILAGVSINYMFGNEGIFSKTQTAVEKYQNAQEKEETEIVKITNAIKSTPETTLDCEILMELAVSGLEIYSTINVLDENGIADYTKCKYIYTNSATKIGTNLSSYTDGCITEKQTNLNVLKGAGDWYLHVLLTDENEKTQEYVSEPVTIDSNKIPNIYIKAGASAAGANGSVTNPYPTVEEALSVATNGQIIYIASGEYEINGTVCSNGEAKSLIFYYSNKTITVIGNNQNSILYYDASAITQRDSALLDTAYSFNNASGSSANCGTINCRNLVFVYKPKNSTVNYEVSIFRFTKGTVENCFFRIIGNRSASYCYDNSYQSLTIRNCTFFHDTKAILSDYSGAPIYTNIATNVAPTNGTRTNVQTQNFDNASSSTSLETLIESSKNNATFNTNSVGVFYGTYAWSK